MKTTRHHEDREQHENEPATELLADGGDRLDPGARVVDRDAAEWRERDPAALAGLCDDAGVRTYTYVAERLREVSDE